MYKETIYREDAIDEMERIMADHPLQGYEDELLLINAIKSLPSADTIDAVSEWITCSERLPEEDICNSYLIAWIPANEKVKCDLPHYYQVADWEDGDWTNLDFCGHEEIVILAWMPLPKPYGERGE